LRPQDAKNRNLESNVIFQEWREEIKKEVEWIPFSSYTKHLETCESCPECKIVCKVCKKSVKVAEKKLHELEEHLSFEVEPATHSMIGAQSDKKKIPRAKSVDAIHRPARPFS